MVEPRRPFGPLRTREGGAHIQQIPLPITPPLPTTTTTNIDVETLINQLNGPFYDLLQLLVNLNSPNQLIERPSELRALLAPLDASLVALERYLRETHRNLWPQIRVSDNLHISEVKYMVENIVNRIRPLQRGELSAIRATGHDFSPSD